MPEAFHFQLRLELVHDGLDQPRAVTLPITQRACTFALPLDEGHGDLRTVRVDPDFRVLAEVGLEAPEQWLVRLLSDPCPVVATRASKALFDKGTSTARAAAVEAMRTHGFWGVRGTIAKQLAKVGGPRGRDALILALAAETNPRALRMLVEALGTFRDEVAATALIGLTDGPFPTWHLHAAVLHSLGKTRDPRAVAVLTEHLSVESWAHLVCARALSGLAETEEESVLPVLLEHSALERPDRVRAAAAAALAKLGDRVESVRERARERLEAMTNEPGFRVQLGSIVALGQLGHTASIPVLSRVHSAAPDGRLRRMAYESLVKIRRGRSTEAGLASLRRQLEELGEKHRGLLERISKVEQGA